MGKCQSGSSSLGRSGANFRDSISADNIFYVIQKIQPTGFEAIWFLYVRSGGRATLFLFFIDGRNKRGTLSLPTRRDGNLPKKIGMEVVRHFFVGLEFSQHFFSKGWNLANIPLFCWVGGYCWNFAVVLLYALLLTII